MLRILAHTALLCILAWTTVTVYTDGTLIVGEVKYKLWFKGEGDSAFAVIQDGVGTVLYTQPFKPGEYYVTAYQRRSQEGEPSNHVILKKDEPCVEEK